MRNALGPCVVWQQREDFLARSIGLHGTQSGLKAYVVPSRPIGILTQSNLKLQGDCAPAPCWGFDTTETSKSKHAL